ncbi:DUF6461 domain-containing protein [Nocardiopsis sp. EMB25]|uniref:DUF6461 domain-containing protein n=1 Tax=Nocardiopsis sp. EMB25 TaxID=2835867 RepID=UPI002283ECD7|nr:DUF6461 domain-containing protein [Nocardiopsis sp. EMB25]MCY9783353.1 DUF6461 domain-containing protein [Nocardiopsis sp. EMB25]
MDVTATAADYLWFEDEPAGLAYAYCLTLVRGLSPPELLRRLDARPESALTGAGEVTEAAFGPRYRDGRQLLAMTGVGEWTLMVEANGFVGVHTKGVPSWSSGTTWVAHFVNINRVGRFLWTEDGVTRVSFDPLFPDDRWGREPDALLEPMRRVGFHLGDGGPEHLSVPAACALAEYVTGVAVTPELLGDTAFTCGSVKP